MARKSAKGRRTAPRKTTSAPRKRRATRKTAAPPNVDDAQFVFRGTVLQRGAATMAEVPPSKHAVVVRVDEVLHGPELVHEFVGQPITVQCDGQTLTDGHEYVFHTNGWLYGSSLAVVCVAVAPATADDVQKMRALASAKPSEDLKARASRADMVVTGRVTQVRQAPRVPGAPITEHDPEWQEAVVKVHHMARGTRRRRPNDITIRFAASRDVKWARAPKFAVGQEGVWMLGDKTAARTELHALANVPKDQYLVVEPEDFYSKEHGDRVLSQIE
jgi:hypothetical protein